MKILGVVVKSGEEVALFPVHKSEKLRLALMERETDIKLLPDGEFVAVREAGKVKFEKLERFKDEPVVRSAIVNYIPPMNPE